MKKQNKLEKVTLVLRRVKIALVSMVLMMSLMTNTVLAASPLDTINSLSDFIFAAIKAIGLILLGFGIVQIGLSLKSHDASQRANGFLTFFGGVIIAFAKSSSVQSSSLYARNLNSIFSMSVILFSFNVVSDQAIELNAHFPADTDVA